MRSLGQDPANRLPDGGPEAAAAAAGGNPAAAGVGPLGAPEDVLARLRLRARLTANEAARLESESPPAPPPRRSRAALPAMGEAVADGGRRARDAAAGTGYESQAPTAWRANRDVTPEGGRAAAGAGIGTGPEKQGGSGRHALGASGAAGEVTRGEDGDGSGGRPRLSGHGVLGASEAVGAAARGEDGDGPAARPRLTREAWRRHGGGRARPRVRLAVNRWAVAGVALVLVLVAGSFLAPALGARSGGETPSGVQWDGGGGAAAAAAGAGGAAAAGSAGAGAGAVGARACGPAA
ncbi:MAG: hypothetical protein LBL01_02265, partial [Bifidobacteriaceae bacterium]|nr:hypothetical protein [Bifidobacteriaceae bacterium]